MNQAQLDSAIAHADVAEQATLDSLKTFLSIPSISTLPVHRSDTRRACEFVRDELVAIGMQNVNLIEGITSDTKHEFPLIQAEWMNAPGKPVLLLYSHYDVQPVDPLDKWVSPPFVPEVRGGNLFARGTADDKGQLWIMLKAIEAYMKTAGVLPVNIKVLFEGEEESDGGHIARYVASKPDWLKDVTSVVVLDGAMFTAGLPTITNGLRGIVCAEVEVTTLSGDRHSGIDGGVAPNAVRELARIIAALETDDGKVAIPGFYDDVLPPDALELASWSKIPFDPKKYQTDIGATALVGDRSVSVPHRMWGLPTLEVHGIGGGFSQEGFKTVIPAQANAKISMRLVPGMDPAKIENAFAAYIKSVTPPQAQSKVSFLGNAAAMVVATSDRSIQLCAQALRETFFKDPVYIRCGGSIPIAGQFASDLNVPILITGFYNEQEANLHAPNENFELAAFFDGIEAFIRYLYLMGQ